MKININFWDLTIFPTLVIFVFKLNRKIRENGCEKRKAGYSASHFLLFAPGSAFTWKVKGFHDLFFCGINKTRNSHEMWKCIVSILYFVVCFAKTLAKCEKCIASLTLFQIVKKCIHILVSGLSPRVPKGCSYNLA